MKRTVPLLITALGGFALIVSFFIPATQSWGERTAIWFDILAAIAFVLGGGNLLKVHLKKISDQQAGWGYSAVTVAAFLVTLVIGLFKLGVGPARNQEQMGESFASLPLSALPEFSVPGSLPPRAHAASLPAAVRAQLRIDGGTLTFRGWMRPSQKQALLGYDSRVEWRCTIERLAAAATLPPELEGAVTYYFEHEVLAFRGTMSPEQEAALRSALPGPAAQIAIDRLAQAARRETAVAVASVPPNLRIPEAEQTRLRIEGGRLIVRGPLTLRDQQLLARRWAGFDIARSLAPQQMVDLLTRINERGRPLRSRQVEALYRFLDASWSPGELRDALNTAGKALPVPKTACQLLEEMNAGVAELEPNLPAGESAVINDAQYVLLERFAVDDSFAVAALLTALRDAGPFTVAQEQALHKFADELPTVGERNRGLALELLHEGPLSREQIDFLLAPYRAEQQWRREVAQLLTGSHEVKYAWSGEYNQQGSAFWWIYEYVFQPLTATMFALLAFYVASAAFRAFRAKNLEAILLLGTAFIILLGRTFAGVLLTSWLPEELSFLRVENLTISIMSIFNTAGNRAIMIGIALGIVSMSLKVLLGVDRSYLGSGDE